MKFELIYEILGIVKIFLKSVFCPQRFWLIVALREHPLSTYADFMAFLTPSPLLYVFHATYQPQYAYFPDFLTPPIPLGAYVLN